MRKVYQSHQKRTFTITKLNRLERSQQKLKYYIGNGNNASLIRRVMSTRKNWEEISDSQHLFINFKWQQSQRLFKYENCVDNKLFRYALNHLEYQQQLSNKELLFKNMADYCEVLKLSVFDYLPLTFTLNLSQTSFEQNQANFTRYFENCMPDSMKHSNRKCHLTIKRKWSTGLESFQKRTINLYSKQDIQPSFQDDPSLYLWIMKTTSNNRGNGIHLFNDLKTLETLINQYIQGVSIEKSSSTSSPESKSKAFRIRQSSQAVLKSTSFVIQKYMEKPLLIDCRKFDIRVWVLITHELKVYFFKQGYLRTSSYQYEINENNISDRNVHLTNNAVQKNNGHYGKFEEGNQLSFKHLQRLVEELGHDFSKLMQQIKRIIKLSVLAVRRKINKLERSWCFEIFGYDFMLDQNCKPYLIEVNTNPCIEESSALLEELLPRMIDDAFNLTLDQMFPTEKTQYNYVLSHERSEHNLWELITELKRA